MKAGEQRAPRGKLGGKTPTLLLAAILLLSCCFVPGVYADQFYMKSSTNDKEILDFLLHKSNYDKRIRPQYDSSNASISNNTKTPNEGDGPLIVNVSVHLLSLQSPDESSLKYEVEFLLQEIWVDPRLKHDDAGRYPYLSGNHHLESIWIPDIFFILHGDFKENFGEKQVSLHIYRNGTVFYSCKRHLVISCTGNLKIFPFDSPSCTFSIESMSYERDDLMLQWRNVTGKASDNGMVRTSRFRGHNAYLIKNTTSTCETSQTDWRGNYSCLQVNLHFSRDDSFYFSTVFIPSIILVTSSFITFWLEWNAVPARVMIGVTTMLNFFTTSNSFRSTLPVVSDLGAMNTWDSVCMFFIYVSLLEFVVVNYVGRKRPKNNMAYMPGENAVIQRIPQAIHRIGLSLREYLTEKKRSDGSHQENMGLPRPQSDDIGSPNRNSHEVVSCANCGNSQCSHSNATNNFPNGEEHNEISQVEYSFSNKRRGKAFTHPIRVAKSIDVISRVVFPVGYTIFLFYFFAQYKGFPSSAAE